MPLGGKKKLTSNPKQHRIFAKTKPMDRSPQAAAYENLSAELLAANLTVPRHVLSESKGEMASCWGLRWDQTIPGDESTSMADL